MNKPKPHSTDLWQKAAQLAELLQQPGALALRLTAGQIAQHRPGGNRETKKDRT